MPRSDRLTSSGSAMHRRLVLLLLAASSAISVAVMAAAAHVDSFSYPVFDGTTTQDFVAAGNSSILLPASLLFDHDVDFNRTEGFLLLWRDVDVWRAGPGGVPAREASFNTSFTLTSGTQPVAFVVLKDSYPPLFGTGGLRGFANYSKSDAEAGATARNASGSLASVEAGPVRSYGPDDPAVGLNVTVTPNRTARAVWIEYDAAAHRLSVYVAGAGEPRPSSWTRASASLAGAPPRPRSSASSLAGSKTFSSACVTGTSRWTVSRATERRRAPSGEWYCSRWSGPWRRRPPSSPRRCATCSQGGVGSTAWSPRCSSFSFIYIQTSKWPNNKGPRLFMPVAIRGLVEIFGPKDRFLSNGGGTIPLPPGSTLPKRNVMIPGKTQY